MTTNTKKVLVSGAGPAGILAAIQLLRRNANDNSDVKYQVTLVDAGRDYGTLTQEELPSHRSWMIGLSNHGLSAIRTVPGLFEDYVSEIGVELDSFSVFIGASEMKQTSESIGQAGENFIVDRNYVVSSLARFLNDKFGNDGAFTRMYHTKVLYVDGDNKRVLVRNIQTNKEEYVDYDVVLGCDGIRSVVRGAMVINHRDFECKVSDIFARFKATHVALPKRLDANSLSLLPTILPKMNGIALPEKGGVVNLSAGYTLNDPCDDELASDDPAVVAAYVKKHLKAFELVDYDDFAQQWVNQSWNSTGQVHCNYYHSDKLKAIIMGDAAHATSPSIGMGMNTALADAAALNRILDECNDDWDAVLPAFSKERVKEGRALTDLAYYLFSHSQSQQIKLLLMGALRTKLSKIFPWMCQDPQYAIGQGEKLSVVYDQATKMGIIPSVRYTNDKIRQEFFEEQAGMVKEPRGTSSWKAPAMVAVAVVAAAAYYLLQSQQSSGPQLM
jgi:kynurenine 3-monooxygenase